MASEAYHHLRDLLELARGFMPHNPVEAYQRVEEVRVALDRAGVSADPELDGLRARAAAMLADYKRAADAWQAENAQRYARFQARQRAVAEGHGRP